MRPWHILFRKHGGCELADAGVIEHLYGEATCAQARAAPSHLAPPLMTTILKSVAFLILGLRGAMPATSIGARHCRCVGASVAPCTEPWVRLTSGGSSP